MATFADLLSTGIFRPIFAFLFVVVISIGFANFIPGIQKKQTHTILFGIVLGFLTLLSPTAIGLVQYLAPWFAIVMFFIALVFIITKYLLSDVKAQGAEFKGVYGVAGAVVLTFLLIGAANYVRDASLYNSGEVTYDEPPRPSLILFNPTLLGAVILLAIAGFAIALLTTSRI